MSSIRVHRAQPVFGPLGLGAGNCISAMGCPGFTRPINVDWYGTNSTDRYGLPPPGVQRLSPPTETSSSSVLRITRTSVAWAAEQAAPISRHPRWFVRDPPDRRRQTRPPCRELRRAPTFLRITPTLCSVDSRTSRWLRQVDASLVHANVGLDAQHCGRRDIGAACCAVHATVGATPTPVVSCYDTCPGFHPPWVWETGKPLDR